jgi:hypothetical protein
VWRFYEKTTVDCIRKTRVDPTPRLVWKQKMPEKIKKMPYDNMLYDEK